VLGTTNYLMLSNFRLSGLTVWAGELFSIVLPLREGQDVVPHRFIAAVYESNSEDSYD
jgi:hypothetical protein